MTKQPSAGPQRTPREVAEEVIHTESNAVAGLVSRLDESFDRAVELLHNVSGRVVCTGMGKSGLIFRKIAATLSSTGTPALFLHPAEAIHGDIGVIGAGDVVLAASFSGKTEELMRLVEVLKRLDVPLIMMTGDADSPLARSADIHLSVAIDREACPLNLAPTASTTATLALGDALAMALLESHGFSHNDFARLHPGGHLGRRLLTVGEMMRVSDELPSVTQTTPLSQMIYEMSRKGLGIAAVVNDQGTLLGCFSDGDLRRLMEGGSVDLATHASEVMLPSPKTIASEELASKALHELETHRITSLFVAGPHNKLEGIVHLHDLWKLELF